VYSPLDEAKDAIASGHEHSAARLLVELEHRKQSPALTPDLRSEIDDAIEYLKEHIPDLEELAANSTSADLGGLSAAQKRTHAAIRSRRGVSSSSARNYRDRNRQRFAHRDAERSPRDRARAAAGAAGTRASRASRSALRQSSVPSGAQSAGQTVVQAAGVGVALSIAYFALGGPGSKAIAGLLGGLGTAIKLLIGPYDPLGGAGQLSHARTPATRAVTPTPSLPAIPAIPADAAPPPPVTPADAPSLIPVLPRAPRVARRNPHPSVPRPLLIPGIGG
jgi:hypothetical protein